MIHLYQVVLVYRESSPLSTPTANHILFNAMDRLKEVTDTSTAENEFVDNPNSTSDLHEFKESEGYVTRTDTEHRGNLKTANNGHTILIPQPSEDPHDPLNWSPVKKHVILFIISFAAFLPDYGSATGAVTLIPQAE